jgi:hypothetical protein
VDARPGPGVINVPEVIIELDLKRRSGVLAGAVAALRKLSLDFQSQQLVDHEGRPRLVLTTRGEIGDLSEIEAAYASARGVSGLADVRVDGVSLMHLPPEPEPELETETSSEVAEPPGEEFDSAPSTVASIDATRAEAAAPATAQIDEREEELFDPEAFARHMLSGQDVEKKSEPPGAPRESAQGNSEDRESAGGLKPSMIRRRRRRR